MKYKKVRDETEAKGFFGPNIIVYNCCNEVLYMQINVVKNASRNLVFGAINKAIAILCPFVTRTVVLHILGTEYLGLNSLFSSILQVLNLSELGFSSAIIYSMYRPVSENDTETVCALLNFYRKVYAAIGVVILILGLCLLPFLPHLISGSYPDDVTLAIPYLLYLGNTVLSYFLFAYMSSLIVVYQRDDIKSRVNAVVTMLMHTAQIIILLTTRNYYLYLLIMPIFTILNNLRIAVVIHRMYPQYHCAGHVSRDTAQNIWMQVGGSFMFKISGTSRHSLDSICLSAFTGLVMTAMYNNYYYIIQAVSSLLSVVSSSFQGGIGNHVATKNEDENYQELKKIDFVYMWAAGWCTICLLCLYQPFMEIWMGRDMLFPFPVIILLCFYFYLTKINDMRTLYLTANGLWYQHRYCSVAEIIGNLVLNITLGRIFGVYGIILATIITVLICGIWGAAITFKGYFGMDKFHDYLNYQIKYLLTTVGICSVTYLCCVLLPIQNTLVNLVVRAGFCIIIPALLWILLYRRSGEFSYVLRIILKRSDNEES